MPSLKIDGELGACSVSYEAPSSRERRGKTGLALVPVCQ